MGTITTRRNKRGELRYTAQIRIQRAGQSAYSESQTFAARRDASTWLKRRETELAKPGALHPPNDPPLRDVIARYCAESVRDIGRTKRAVLASIAASSLGDTHCSQLTSPALVAWAQGLTDMQPQTRDNYLSHLSAVVAVARPAWGYPLDEQAMRDARAVCKRLGLTSKSRERSRRPTAYELDRLTQYYTQAAAYRRQDIPMVDIIWFAIHSTRRLDEITRIRWDDLDASKSEIVVRDMKHPGDKTGNDVRVHLPPEAMAIIQKQQAKKNSGAIWPLNPKSISTSFTRACKALGIDDLHFHDLRHEGISRLFESGMTIPQVACVSGHRTWVSLKRYTHLFLGK